MKSTNKRGSILFTSILHLTVAAVGVMGLVKFVTSSQGAAVRYRDYFSSFYAAESGVEQVVDFFNNPVN